MPMRSRMLLGALLAPLLIAAASVAVTAQITADAPATRPTAIVDLATAEGLRLVQGQWRDSDVRIVDVEHPAPGPDLRPSGPPNRTYRIPPHPGPARFRHPGWPGPRPARVHAPKGAGGLEL